MLKLIRTLGACAVMLSLALPVGAQGGAEYPDHPIRMLLPFAAGGGGDVLGRLLAVRMGVRLKQTIIVENKTGAAGTIGTQAVAAAPADGYTISIGGMTTHILAPVIYPNLRYDPIKDFTTLGRIGTSSILMIATNDFPANNLKEFIALAKAKGNLQYGSWGQGSTGQLLRRGSGSEVWS